MKTLKLLSLEPRVLLDAAAATTAIDVHADINEQTEAFNESQSDYSNSTSEPVPLGTVPLTESQNQWELLNTAGVMLNQVQAQEVVVVDTSIQNYQLLLESVNPESEIIYIDPTQDGIIQMADALRGRKDISALHILSHGSEGSLALGTSLLNGETISEYQALLAEIGESLTDNGDILFYGCNVADGTTGVAFVSELAEITGADVAASDDVTGADDKGGGIGI
ncbi:MAG: DUF4347 domain-containing protein [Methylococcales bacterium]|nr:DUF4347 domain-containing protein [Methylococcales bacterium]